MEDFHRGQKFQFLVDFYPISYNSGRRYGHAINYVKSLSPEEIDQKCKELSDKKLPVYSVKKDGNISIKCHRMYNKRLELLQEPDKYPNRFYFGRCYQFLIDSGSKNVDTITNVVKYAHRKKFEILKRKDCDGHIYKAHLCTRCTTTFHSDNFFCEKCSSAKRYLDYRPTDKEEAHLDLERLPIYIPI
jgi:hypothetical protein